MTGGHIPHASTPTAPVDPTHVETAEAAPLRRRHPVREDENPESAVIFCNTAPLRRRHPVREARDALAVGAAEKSAGTLAVKVQGEPRRRRARRAAGAGGQTDRRR